MHRCGLWSDELMVIPDAVTCPLRLQQWIMYGIVMQGKWNVSCEWPGCLVNSISGESVSGAEHGGPWASRQRGSCSPCAGYNYTPIRIHTVPPLFRKMWVRLPIIHLVLLIYSCTPRDFTWCMTSVLFQPRNNKGLTTVVRRLCELIRTEELRLIKVFGQSNVHDYDYEYECQY